MTGWFFANLGWASLVMLLVLAVRRPVALWFGAGIAYALWLLPALRLVAPPLPSLAPDLPTLAPPEPLIVWVEDAAPLQADGGAFPWVSFALALWALGAIALLAWQFVSYRRFVAEIDAGARNLGLHRGLELVESDAVDGPVALGLFRRRIVVPVDFVLRYTAEEQRLALDHETIHHQRGDLWWNHLGLLVLAANWFNPIAWLAFRAFRADQELACDAAVAASATPDARLDYARALIKSASRPGLIATCPLNHADQLKRRLKMMKSHRASRLRLLGGVAAVGGLAAISFALGTPGLAAGQAAPEAATPKQGEAAPTRERAEERIIIHRIERGERTSGAQSGSSAEGTPRERRIIVLDGGEGVEHTAHGDARVHSFTLRRDGSEGAGTTTTPSDREVRRFNVLVGDGRHRVMAQHLVDADCHQGQRSEVNEGDAKERTRVVLCTGGDSATPAQRADRLARLRERLSQESELSAEQRARVTAAIDREIARLRDQ